MLKRTFDIVLASLALVLLSPIIAATAVFVRIAMGGPVLFRQVRPGLRGKPFLLYKFRTMRELRSPAGESLPDGARLTRAGKWLRELSLDELPQLVNVISGDLSLVGPRPLLMEYLPLYSNEQTRRHEVRPGITGLAQVNGRNATTWEERLRLDVWYVDHRTFWMDIRILWLSAVKVLRKEGISQNGQETMERFKGSSPPSR